MKKKSVFISLYPAYPPNSGAASVTYNAAKYMSGEVTLLQGGVKSEKINIEGLNCISVCTKDQKSILKLFRIIQLINNLIIESVKIKPDLIFLEGAVWVGYLWLLFILLKIRLPNCIYAYHAHNVEYFLRKEKQSFYVVMMTRWFENKLCRNSDYCFAVSSIDAAQILKLYGVKARIMPNGVDTSIYENCTESDCDRVRKKYNIDNDVILFMGFYGYAPNKQAIDMIVQQIMPDIICENNNLKLAVLGSKIPYSKPWLKNPGNIPFEDLVAFIKSCAIGVAPIFMGSGTRLKVVEYMASGIPVVASRKGAEGLNLADGENVLFAENSEQFVNKILSLLEDKQLSKSISFNALQLINESFCWQNIMNEISNIIFKDL